MNCLNASPSVTIRGICCCLEATEHRIHELRGTAAGALPGKSPVVLDPALKLVVDVFPCEDGHAQERALPDQVLPTVEAGDCWIEDRNFCTLKFLFTVAERARSRDHRAGSIRILRGG